MILEGSLFVSLGVDVLHKGIRGTGAPFKVTEGENPISFYAAYYEWLTLWNIHVKN